LGVIHPLPLGIHFPLKGQQRLRLQDGHPCLQILRGSRWMNEDFPPRADGSKRGCPVFVCAVDGRLGGIVKGGPPDIVVGSNQHLRESGGPLHWELNMMIIHQVVGP